MARWDSTGGFLSIQLFSVFIFFVRTSTPSDTNVCPVLYIIYIYLRWILHYIIFFLHLERFVCMDGRIGGRVGNMDEWMDGCSGDWMDGCSGDK